ncbi:Na+/H+ antiporter NhaA [Azotobacter salinestris]
MALFIGDLAFDARSINQAKPGLFLASLFSATAGLLRLLRVTRQKNHAL